jgi:hypothetical protein
MFASALTEKFSCSAWRLTWTTCKCIHGIHLQFKALTKNMGQRSCSSWRLTWTTCKCIHGIHLQFEALTKNMGQRSCLMHWDHQRGRQQAAVPRGARLGHAKMLDLQLGLKATRTAAWSRFVANGGSARSVSSLNRVGKEEPRSPLRAAWKSNRSHRGDQEQKVKWYTTVWKGWTH